MRTGRDLTLSDVKKIIKLREKGLPMRQIAKLVGFSAMTVQRVIHSQDLTLCYTKSKLEIVKGREDKQTIK